MGERRVGEGGVSRGRLRTTRDSRQWRRSVSLPAISLPHAGNPTWQQCFLFVCVCIGVGDISSFCARTCRCSQRVEAVKWSSEWLITGSPEQRGTPMTSSITSSVKEVVRGCVLSEFYLFLGSLEVSCSSLSSNPFPNPTHHCFKTHGCH